MGVGVEHHFTLRNETLADTMKLLAGSCRRPRQRPCKRVDFVLVVYRRLAKHGGRGKRVEERTLARVYATDPDDVLDECLAIMPWQAHRHDRRATGRGLV